MYELIAAGEIETIKVGTITPVPLAALAAFVDVLRRGQRYLSAVRHPATFVVIRGASLVGSGLSAFGR
jgi:hypothetical protein